MIYVIGAIIISLIFFSVGLMLIFFYTKSKINEEVLKLHDNFILSVIAEHKRKNGKIKLTSAFKRKKTFIQYIVFSLISFVSFIYFSFILFQRYL